MNSFVFVLLVYCFCYVYGAAYEKTNHESDNESKTTDVNHSNEFYSHNLLPKSLIESIQLQKESQSRNGRILNDLQFVQHSSNAQSIYLPHSVNQITTAANPNAKQEIIDLQVPTTTNTNRVLLQLPSQQLPLHNAFIVPPRRHYRITLIRNRKPTPAPQQSSPEVEEKTLIYVLVKKPDETSAQIEEMQNNEQNNVKHNAPEVYFIKYKDNNTVQNVTSTNDQIDVKN